MTPHSAMSSEQDARSLSGMVSLKNRYSQPMNPTHRVSFQYDASRLDQVISSAKGFAQGLDGDTRRDPIRALIKLRFDVE
jgi:hypothetical protein